MSDEDLVAMYLTDKKLDVSRESSDHEELEVLLETFAKQVEEVVNEAENIQVRIAAILICAGVHDTIDQCAIDARDRRTDSGRQS
jgi:hypothetical protein